MGQGPGLRIDVLMQLTAGDRAVVFIVLLVGLALKALILWWLYVDTTAHGRRPLWWLVAAFFLDIPTLIAWLIVRPPHPGDATTMNRTPNRPPERRGDPLPLGEDPYRQRATDPMEPPYRPTPESPFEDDPSGAREAEVEAEADGEEVPLTCPQCGTRFHARRGEGPRRVSCPECGRGGTLPGRAR